MALMEAMSSGVPVVSTPIGMAVDIIVNGKNGTLSELINANSLSESLIELIEMINQGKFSKTELRNSINSCSWPVVAKNHLKYVYQPLINLSKNEKFN